METKYYATAGSPASTATRYRCGPFTTAEAAERMLEALSVSIDCCPPFTVQAETPDENEADT